MEKNLTTGSVLHNVLYFSLPYLLSYFLQTLYGMADLFIIGQFEGAASTTAVSVGSQVMHMITVMIVGLAMGSTVGIGRHRRRGAQTRYRHYRQHRFLVYGGIRCPDGSAAPAGTPHCCHYVYPGRSRRRNRRLSDHLLYRNSLYHCIQHHQFDFPRLGDSKSPMYFIAVACVANIALDYLFIGAMGLGPAGAALGTTLSQAISVVVSLAVILKRQTGINLRKEDLKLRRPVLRQILKIGLPVALQDGFIQIAFIVITIIANRRGLSDAAAVGIVEKVISFLFLVPSSMLSTVSALGAQNIGAGKHERAALTLRYAIFIAAGFGLCISIVMQWIAEPVVGLFTTDAVVILAGGQYIRGYIWDCLFAGIHFSFSGYFCAYGRSEISFLHNIAAILLIRIPGVYLMSNGFPDSLFPMGLATVGGSLLSISICVAAFVYLKRRGYFDSVAVQA